MSPSCSFLRDSTPDHVAFLEKMRNAASASVEESKSWNL